MKNIAKTCPLCDEAAFQAFRYGLLRCENCSLVIDRAIWVPEINAEMEERFFAESYQPPSSFWVRQFEASNIRRVMRRLRRHARANAKLLEIGVGSGALLSKAKTQGFVAMGCDVSPSICERVQRHSGVEVYCGPIESMPADQKFDVIVMNHVLEHVGEPLAFLRSVRGRLRPGGLLHLVVPNIEAWEAKLPGWNSYEPYHLSYYTPKTLRDIVIMAGFQVFKINTHESFSGWFLAIMRTLLGYHPTTTRWSNNASGSLRPALRHFYYLALVAHGFVTFPFRKFQAMAGRGDEVIVLARNSSDVR